MASARTNHRASLVDRLVALAPFAFGVGEPAVDGVADPRGPHLAQVAVVVCGVVIHAGMYVYAGLAGFLWVALLSLVYLAVGVPLTHRLASLSPGLATWADLAAMTLLALVMGDPVTLIAWFPIVVFANLLYVPTREAIRHLTAQIGLVAALYYGMTQVSERLFSDDVVRVYLGATLVMWLLVSVVYALSVGGSVSRRDAAVAAALAERDDAELRVRAEASRLRAVFDEAPIGLMLQAEDGTFVYGNAPALELLGLTLDELLTRGAAPAMDPATRLRVEAEIVSARESGKPFAIEHETVNDRILELRGRHVELADGYNTVTTLRDLTPERDAHRHIARLRTLVENSETHMVVWDTDGTILLGNRIFRDLWTSGEQAVGRSIIDVVGEQIRPFVEMRRLGSERTYERQTTGPDGRVLWASLSVLDFQDPVDGRWLRAVSVRDLTEVAYARRQLEELVANKDQFIASVSHELRTPLTVVVGLAAEMASNPSALSSDEIVEFSSLIAAQAGEVAALVEDLLTMARAEAGVLSVEPLAIDLHEAVRDVLGGLPLELRERVRWDHGAGATVHADPVRVRQIVRNLLTNAGRHGGLLIQATVEPGMVTVRDDGPPVPESERERMFQAYERVHQRAGTPDSVGLGLTVCRRLSRLMGGDVTYEHDGVWSTFRLTLPEVGSLRAESVAASLE